MRDIVAQEKLQMDLHDSIGGAKDQAMANAEEEVLEHIQDSMYPDMPEADRRAVGDRRDSGPSGGGRKTSSATGSSHGSSSSSGSTAKTPSRERLKPTMTLPEFPGPSDAREPVPLLPYTPSPSASPAPRSPFRRSSPEPGNAATSSTPARPKMLSAFSSPAFQFSNAPGAQSPWMALAASSGAPTPSLEGPSRSNNSPQLGYPFERLNIGSSWSGANLFAEPADQPRRASMDPPAIPSRGPTSLTSETPSASLSLDTVARYRSLIGRASADAARSQGKGHGLPSEAAGLTGLASTNMPAPTAIPARRRASLPHNQNAYTGLSPPSSQTHTPSPLAAAISSSVPNSSTSRRLQPLSMAALQAKLGQMTTLVLDIRPPSSFASSHLPDSHSIAVPSTLLRRPAFNLQKLGQMLNPSSKKAVSEWNEKKDIVILDSDSGSAPEGSVIDGLAGKFDREGFNGQMWYVRGGHDAIQNTPGLPLIADDGSEAPQVDSTEAQFPGLMAGRLGTLAFLQESTGSGQPSRSQSNSSLATQAIPIQTPGTATRHDSFISGPPSAATERPTSGSPFKRNSMTLHPSESVSSFQSNSSRGSRLQPANPFFDNIRQNLELSHDGISERIPLNLPDIVISRGEELPSWLRGLVTGPEITAMDRLAEEFYKIELREQKRLQAVMDWHTKESGSHMPSISIKSSEKEEIRRVVAEASPVSPKVGEHDYFPFSITAGVERGTKNRYKNIWPYDFSRVRLGKFSEEDSDYINASFVQPRGTSRRYIATQGPMNATFRDFWTLIWEQDVRVIVMITKQFEGGLLKCGNYWQEDEHGHLRVQLISQAGDDNEKPATAATTGFDFGVAAASPRPAAGHDEGTIKRIFKLTNLDLPDTPSRLITQIQCVSWPDFDVPDSPVTLLNLIKEVDTAMNEMHGFEGAQTQEHEEMPPVLVHCSAGVGRTGSYIVVDAVIDAIRRERGRRERNVTEALMDDPALQRFRNLHSGPSSPVDLTHTANSPAIPLGQKPGLLPSPPATRHRSFSQSFTNPFFEGSINREEMDVRMRTPSPESPDLHERFTKHRGSAVSVDSDAEPPKRPGLISPYISEEKVPHQHDQRKDLPTPPTITKSHRRHRDPTPLSQMDNPVPSILESMRIQRMSLVQSLRQYVFVHRAIITWYLMMLDAENGDPSDPSDFSASPSASASRASTAPLSTTTATSVTGEDDTHQKRRASPTELRPEIPAATEKVPAGNTGLAKRASFKKMRGSSESVPIYSPTPSQASVSVSGSLGSMLSASGNTRSPDPRSLRSGTGLSGAGSSASSTSSGGSGGSGSGVGRMRNRLRATLEMQEKEEEEDNARKLKK